MRGWLHPAELKCSWDIASFFVRKVGGWYLNGFVFGATPQLYVGDAIDSNALDDWSAGFSGRCHVVSDLNARKLPEMSRGCGADRLVPEVRDKASL